MRATGHAYRKALPGGHGFCQSRTNTLGTSLGGNSKERHSGRQGTKASHENSKGGCRPPSSKETGMKQNTLQTAFLFLAIAAFPGPAMLYGIQPNPTIQPIRKQAWKMLWDGAHSSDTEERSSAVQALGLLRASPPVVALAESALQDKDPGVREAAATALGEMHSSSSVPELKKALSDNDISVALAAARSLLLLNRKAGYDLYYAVLTGKRKSGQSLLSQQLEQIDSPTKMVEFAFDQGIGFLPYAGYGMEVLQALTKKDNSPLRAAAARILERDSDPRSAQALAKACSDKDWIVRVAAVRAVAMRGNPALLPEVKADMKDDNDSVRYMAAAGALRLTSVKSRRPERGRSSTTREGCTAAALQRGKSHSSRWLP